MKKVFPYILILTIIVQLFAPFTVGTGVKNNLEVRANKAEAADCTIIGGTFSVKPPATLPTTTSSTKPEELTYSVQTTNCVGKLVKTSVLSYSGPSTAFGSPELPIQRISGDNFSFTFHTGEKTCSGNDCDDIRIGLKILNDSGDTIEESESSQHLAYKCATSGCKDPWILKSTTNTELPAQTNCKVTNVLFMPATTSQTVRPDSATLYINTSGCQGQLFNSLNIKASGTSTFTIPRSTITSDNTSFKLKTGEKSCSGKDCDITVDFYIMNSVNGTIILHYGDGGTKMHFKCKDNGTPGDCGNSEWSLESSTGANQTTGGSSTVDVYYFEITDKDNKVTTSASFPTEPSCKAVRDARAEAEKNANSGAQVSECTKKTITQTTNDGHGSSDNNILPGCGLLGYGGTFMGCVAQAIYYVLFVPTSYIFALTGVFFDFTFHYSVQDGSYRTPFVVEGWGIVRDLCNMFFIFVLLYIAFGTILNIHSVKTKEMIINVVIIGLLINFSLFATQVIVDASNILARVFYNSNTIKITQQKNDADPANGVTNITPGLKEGPNGEIPLSAAIVNKVNPQNLIINGTKAVTIHDKVTNESSSADDVGKEGNLSIGAFILITLLATAVNVFGMITFLSIGLVFVARVIGLWIAMILSPFVFFSYTVPTLQDMEMVGWKKWWPETLKLAFLAPVFIFFMYLIIAFLEKGLSLVSSHDTGSMDGMTFVISVIVPFIFIIILLTKAKDIAKKMSGTMGEMAVKAGSAVGGMALGAGVGLGAMAMRGTVGRLGNKIATSEWAKTHGAIGRGIGNIGKWTGSKSFDIRATKLGAMAGKGMDVDMGKAKEGGYSKHLKDKVERRQKRAKELEVSENEDLKQNLNNLEMDHQNLLREYSHKIEVLDKRIKTARENSADAAAEFKADPTNTVKKQAAQDAAAAVLELKSHKKAIKNGNMSYTVTSLTDSTLAPGTSSTIYLTDNGLATGTQNNITSSGKSINQLEDFEIPHAHDEIEKQNRNRKWAYAKAKSRWGGRANKEAAHKIRMEEKLDSGEKSH